MTANMFTLGASVFDVFERGTSVLSLKPFTNLTRGKLLDVVNRLTVLLTNIVPMHSSDIVFQYRDKFTIRDCGPTMPSFRGAVDHVESIVSEHKVLRVHAFPVVASVAYECSKRYFAIRHFVRDSMSKFLSNVRVNGKHSIPFVVFVGLPFPTFIFGLNRNFGPKSFCKHSMCLGVFPSEVKRAM